MQGRGLKRNPTSKHIVFLEEPLSHFLCLFKALGVELCRRAKGEDISANFDKPEVEVTSAKPEKNNELALYAEQLFKGLPETMKRNFVHKKRCTFSWMTDSTTTYLLNEVLAQEPYRTGPVLLYNLLIGHVINDIPTLQGLGFPFKLSAPLTGDMFRKLYPYYRVAPSKLKEGGSFEIYTNLVRGPSPAFAGSTRNLLFKYAPSFEEALPMFLNDLAANDCHIVKNMWEEMMRRAEGQQPIGKKALSRKRRLAEPTESPALSTPEPTESPALSTLRESKKWGLKANFPFFLALVVSRLLSLENRNLHDINRFDIGVYAAKAFDTLAPGWDGPPETIFREFCEQCMDRLNKDTTFKQVLHTLESELCVAPLSAQSFEHLLCEYRKLIADDKRRMNAPEGKRTPGVCFKSRLQAVHHILCNKNKDKGTSKIPGTASKYVPYELAIGCPNGLQRLLQAKLASYALSENGARLQIQTLDSSHPTYKTALVELKANQQKYSDKLQPFRPTKDPTLSTTDPAVEAVDEIAQLLKRRRLSLDPLVLHTWKENAQHTKLNQWGLPPGTYVHHAPVNTTTTVDRGSVQPSKNTDPIPLQPTKKVNPVPVKPTPEVTHSTNEDVAKRLLVVQQGLPWRLTNAQNQWQRAQVRLARAEPGSDSYVKIQKQINVLDEYIDLIRGQVTPFDFKTGVRSS